MTTIPPRETTPGTDPPRMVVSDMDGTLLGADGYVSERNAAALHRAAEAGAHVVIATGRPMSSLGPVLEVGFTGLAVCMNGAVVYDVAAGEVLSSIELQPGDMTTFVAALESFEYPFALAADRLEGSSETFWADHHYTHPWADRFYHRVERSELVSVPAAKLLVHYDAPSDEAAAIAFQAAGGRVSVTYSSGDGLVEVAALGVSKGAVLATLAATWGVNAADVIAFGDMPNDIEMLQWAGRAIAMENAQEDVVAAATEIGPHHTDDAVAAVLERWF